MQIFTEKDKMVALIKANYHLLPVINRFGIKLGFGDKTVEQICIENGIDKSFFLAIVNAFHNEDYFPEQELLSFSPLLILDYLKQTHKYYTEYILPKLESQLTNMLSNSGPGKEEIGLIELFYKKYEKELLQHIRDEENVVFPYVVNLINNNLNEKRDFRIIDFKNEHTNVENQINDLRNLLLMYISPVYDQDLCNEFLITLSRFEKDIMDHARIEDVILVPRVMAIEKEMRG